MPIRKILVGVDFSDGAEAAIKQGLDIARRHDAELVLVHAGEIPEQATIPAHVAGGLVEEYEKAIRHNFEVDHDQLEKLGERLRGQGAEVSQVFVHGAPDEAMAKAAEEMDADLVVVGTHGRTGFDRFVMGSSAERIIRVCPRTVLVARPGPPENAGYRRILVAIDFSELSQTSINLAASLAADEAVIEVFHAWKVPYTALTVDDPVAGYPGSLARDLAEDASRRATELVSKAAARQGLQVSFHHAEGSAGPAIHQRLEQGDYDLAVMGSHGHRGFRKWLIGTVTEQTVRHAPCSVAVVKPQG